MPNKGPKSVGDLRRQAGQVTIFTLTARPEVRWTAGVWPFVGRREVQVGGCRGWRGWRRRSLGGGEGFASGGGGGGVADDGGGGSKLLRLAAVGEG